MHLVAGMGNDRPGGSQAQAAHDSRHDQVWPTGTGPDHAKGCQEHRHVPDHVIASAKPYRPHVGVAIPIGNEKQGDQTIRGERQKPDCLT